MSDYSNPAKSLQLLDELEACGFSDKAFSILHHFDQPQKIATHRNYCDALCKDGKRFRTSSTNALVQRRLEKVWQMYRAAQLTAKSSALFEHLASAVLLELPHGAISANAGIKVTAPGPAPYSTTAIRLPPRDTASNLSAVIDSGNPADVFNNAIARIKHAYLDLGHSLGWRFLCVAKATLNSSTNIALITANPGGSSFPPDHPPASCENGSAYLVEQWGSSPRGKQNLQIQVQNLFHALALEMNYPESGDALLEQSLIGYFIPFRSPTLDKLHRREESFTFAHALWSDIFEQIRPRLIVAIDRDTYSALGPIISNKTGARKVSGIEVPTGWGTLNANVDEYRSADYATMLIRLPHLSRFTLFASPGCREPVKQIIKHASKFL